MKIKILFIICIYNLFFAKHVFTQISPNIEWQNTIGGNGSDELRNISKTSDGGYIIGGSSDSKISPDKSQNRKGLMDYWIVKINATGSIEWDKTIGGSKNDFLSKVYQTTDGGYILGGSSFSNISGDKTEANFSDNPDTEDFWVVKIDSNGVIEWDKTLGGNSFDALGDIKQTPDGGYIVGGQSSSDISGNKTEGVLGWEDYWIIKLNSTGDIEWQNTLQGAGREDLNCLLVTSDDGFLIGGWSDSGISGDKTQASNGSNDFWIIKMDNAGVLEWQKSIGGSGSEILNSLEQTADGGYVCFGWSSSEISGDKTEARIGFNDFWVLKIDATGNIQWQNTIGGNEYDDGYAVRPTTDNGYILGGDSGSGISGDKTEINETIDYWILKLDSTGTIQWQNTIGGYQSDVLLDLVQADDGGYVAAGFSNSAITGDKTELNYGFTFDYWIVKLYSECLISSTITPSGPTTFCAGSSVILNAPVDFGYTYQWKKDGVNIAGATASNYTANQTGNYQVFISNGTCDDISDSILVIRNPKPNPVITNVDATNDLCFDPSIKLKTANGIGFTFQWYNGVTAIPGATSNIYFATTPGNYRVKTTNGFGCFKNSTTYAIINSCKTINNYNNENISINIYPNPTSSILFIETKGFNNNIEFEIYNSIGQKVLTEQLNNSENIELNVSDLAKGIYTLAIWNGEKRIVGKFVRE